MRAYVTGASGFVGRHVVRELEERGWEVGGERVDLLDHEGLDQAVEGCHAVFHVAALYSYDADIEEMRRVNVDGTRAVVEACQRQGVGRLVYCSTAGTCGPVAGRPANEEDEPPPWELAVPYKRTKVEAERVVLDAAADGLDAVVVNPTTPVGEGDDRPTPTGRMVRQVATGRIPGYVPTTGLNVVDVEDVAVGHVLAFEHGVRGQRYLLGGHDMTLEDLFATIARLAGRPRPRIRVPYWVAQAVAGVGLANRDEVRLARLPMYFSSLKAETTLGYRPGPVLPALERAVRDALVGTGKGGA
ncbi:MAG: NAD-dependent epimerase/dehydratase family protein [Thermoleophilia bacterium]